MGIFFALISLLSWGVGDFLIQRSARKFGDWLALFYITAFAAVVLLPFVARDLAALFSGHGLLFLLVTSCVLVFAAYFDFEALRLGKISVIEPVYAFEIVITALLAFAFAGERLTVLQTLLVFAVMTGIFCVSTASFRHFKNIKWEKGVFLAIVATAAMGAVNFLFGQGARQTSPLLVNWFTSAVTALVSFLVLAATGQKSSIVPSLKKNPGLIFGVSFMDNLAWVAFSYAALYIPIAVATSFSESYIVLAALLGIIYNKEKLAWHQKAGLAVTVVAAVMLAAVTKD